MAVVLPIVIVAGLCSPGVSREDYIWERKAPGEFWGATLTALGGRLGLPDPQVEARSICVDARRQWRHSRNVWHNSMVRSVLQTVAAPVTGLGRLVRGMKSRTGG